MVYFLINNNYHFNDVAQHVSAMNKMDIHLIQIPHTLELIKKDNRFKKIYTYFSPLKTFKSSLHILKVVNTFSLINNDLKINKDDILFFYTEFELLNQYIVNHFKKHRAKVYLIEDGGFATYIPLSQKTSEPLSVQTKIKLVFNKYILGMKYMNYLRIGNILFPQISDFLIDGIILFRPVKLTRDIKVYILEKPIERMTDLDSNIAIFLNEDSYNHYETEEKYLKNLYFIIKRLSSSIKILYFKFHPRELTMMRTKIREGLKDIPNVTFVENDQPIENIISLYKPKFAISYASAALLNLSLKGIEPIYVFHWCDNLMQNKIFKDIKRILNQMGYHFLDKNNKALNEYNSKLVQETANRNITLLDLVHE